MLSALTRIDLAVGGDTVSVDEFWKADVNLLVRLYVGGSSAVSIRFRIGGTELPLRSWE